MSATQTKPTEQILGKISELHNEVIKVKEQQAKQDEILAGVLKAAETPASKAGLSPTEFISRMTDGGNKAFVIGSDGTTIPVSYSNTGRRLGNVVDPDDGKTKNFGEYLTLWQRFRDRGYADPQVVERLDKHFGVRRLVENDQGTYSKAALMESSGVTGGYTVPLAFSTDLIRLAAEESIVESRARKFPLTARQVQIPMLDMTTRQSAGTTPYFGGVKATWHAEGQTRDESEPTFRQLTLTAWELSFYAIVSNNLLADNAVGLDAVLSQIFPSAIAWYKDYAFLRGDGAGKPLGVLNANCTLGVTKQAASRIYYPDLGNMLNKFMWTQKKNDSVCWIIHQSAIGELVNLTDNSAGSGNGRLVFQPINQGAQAAISQSGPNAFGYLLGFPVFVTEKMPALNTDGCFMLCDFDKYAIGNRMELQVNASTEVRFLNNQMVWRIIARVDGQPLLSDSIRLSDGSHTISPFIYLDY